MRSTYARSFARTLPFAVAALALYACGGTGGTDDGTLDPGAGAGASAGSAGGAGKAGTGGAAAGAAGKGGSGGSSGGAGAPGGSGGATGGAAGASGGGGSAGTGGAPCADGTITCDGKTKKVCDGKGGFKETTVCPKECADGKGCVECLPGIAKCDGTNSVVCKSDGSGTETFACDGDLGLTCVASSGKCSGACSKENLERSYIGCEYFPTVTSNGQLFKGFSFAIAVANTTASPANVKVFRGATMVTMATVAAGSVSTLKLPWVDELKNSYDGDAATLTSVLAKGGAYHVKSDQPVTVYQFNPLEFTIPDPGGCAQGGFPGCNSYTNDASLLLPANALGTSYIAASSPALAASSLGTVNSIPGLLSITATQDGTKVTVKSSANVRAGSGVTAMKAGDTQTFTMNQGDVVQLLTAVPGQGDLSSCKSAGLGGPTVCVVAKTFDLTSTTVDSDKPIAVLGGHDCTYLPYNFPACDHIEETIFPANTLGKEVLVTAPQSVLGAKANSGAADKHLIRVISAVDANAITIDPLPTGASNGTLNKGQYADVPVTDQDIQIKGTGPLLVVQYMLGGDLVDPGNSGTADSKGDPSMSLGIPSAQYRKSYTFLAPDTYTYNFVNVVAPKGATVMLDGQALTGPAPKDVGGSGFTVIRKAIAGGTHTATSDVPFGIVVYGYGAYTSYMYPGGLNLNAL